MRYQNNNLRRTFQLIQDEEIGQLSRCNAANQVIKSVIRGCIDRRHLVSFHDGDTQLNRSTNVKVNMAGAVKVFAVFVVGAEAYVLETVLVDLEIAEDRLDIRVHASRHYCEHHTETKTL